MNQAEYNEQARALFNIIMYHAPDGKVRKQILHEFNHMPAAWTNKERLRSLTAMLYDGLTFGNWPGK